ncbi:MAG: hypothetical protein OQK12_09895 [Motiliproteus sp.]|nr:hypothetical protein [Motiliproteus sp.]MCW9051271.1 hypothetical protein [Motiliproteus sp.]
MSIEAYVEQLMIQVINTQGAEIDHGPCEPCEYIDATPDDEVELHLLLKCSKCGNESDAVHQGVSTH